MSAPVIQANYDDLKTIASVLTRQADQTFALMRSVGNCLETLRGSWLGKGARQFYAEMDHEVLPAVQRLRAALDEASTAVRRTATLLEEHERQAGLLFFGEGSLAEQAGTKPLGGLAATLAATAALSAVPAALPFAAGNNFATILKRVLEDKSLASFMRVSWSGAQIALKELSSDPVKGFIEKHLKINSDAFKRFSNALGKTSGAFSKITGGALSGALVGIAFDFLNGTPITGETIATHMLSGGVKAVVSLTAGGGIALLADAGIQALGTIGSAFIAENAEVFSYGNLARAEEIRRHATDFQRSFNHFSLNGFIDKSAAAIVEGFSKGDLMVAAGGVAKASVDFIGGGLGTLVHGAALAKNIGDSIGDAVKDMARGFDKIVSSAAEQAARGFLGLFGIR